MRSKRDKAAHAINDLTLSVLNLSEKRHRLDVSTAGSEKEIWIISFSKFEGMHASSGFTHYYMCALCTSQKCSQNNIHCHCTYSTLVYSAN